MTLAEATFFITDEQKTETNDLGECLKDVMVLETSVAGLKSEALPARTSNNVSTSDDDLAYSKFLEGF